MSRIIRLFTNATCLAVVTAVAMFAAAATPAWAGADKEQQQMMADIRMLQEQAQTLQNLLRSLTDAIKALRKFVKMDPAVAPAGYDQYRDSFPVDGKIAEKGITIVADQEFETGRLKKKISVEDMMDRSFISLLGKK